MARNALTLVLLLATFSSVLPNGGNKSNGRRKLPDHLTKVTKTLCRINVLLGYQRDERCKEFDDNQVMPIPDDTRTQYPNIPITTFRPPFPTRGRPPFPTRGHPPFPTRGRPPFPTRGRPPFPTRGRPPFPPFPTSGRPPFQTNPTRGRPPFQTNPTRTRPPFPTRGRPTMPPASTEPPSGEDYDEPWQTGSVEFMGHLCVFRVKPLEIEGLSSLGITAKFQCPNFSDFLGVGNGKNRDAAIKIAIQDFAVKASRAEELLGRAMFQHFFHK